MPGAPRALQDRAPVPIRGGALTELTGTCPAGGKTPPDLAARPRLHQRSRERLRPTPPHLFDGLLASVSVSGRHSCVSLREVRSEPLFIQVSHVAWRSEAEPHWISRVISARKRAVRAGAFL